MTVTRVLLLLLPLLLRLMPCDCMMRVTALLSCCPLSLSSLTTACPLSTPLTPPLLNRSSSRPTSSVYRLALTACWMMWSRCELSLVLWQYQRSVSSLQWDDGSGFTLAGCSFSSGGEAAATV